MDKSNEKSNLYETILSLCEEKGITGGKMCTDIGVSKSLMTDLSAKPDKGINLKTAAKIADYFGVSVDYLLGGERNSAAKISSYNETIPNAVPHLSDDENDFLQTLHDSPGMRIMFSTSKNRSEADIREAAAIIEAFYKTKDGNVQ